MMDYDGSIWWAKLSFVCLKSMMEEYMETLLDTSDIL